MNSMALTHEQMQKRDAYGKVIAGAILCITSGVVLAVMLFVPKSVIPVAPRISSAPDAYKDISLSAKAVVVYDLTTGAVLYGKNEYSQLPLASITKLLSIYAAADTLSNTSTVQITKQSLAMDGDNGFKEGQSFSFSDLARFSLVASSNDGAEAIAETAALHRGASNTNLLASAVAALGLDTTYAINGTGLDENTTTAGAYGSALDIAKLAGGLLVKVPSIARATIDPSIEIKAYDGARIRAKNTNPDVIHTPGLLLSKTGYTDLAGGNLVIVFDAGLIHPIAIVVLGSTREERFTDTEKLLSATLDHFAGLSSTL